MRILLLLGASSFLLSLVLTPLLRNLFRRLGILDHPGENRKIHAEPIPRIGGIALLLSLALSVSMVSIIAHAAQLTILLKVFPAALLIFSVGFLDDLVRLRPWQKLFGEAIAAGWAYAVGVRLLGIGGMAMEDWWILPATVFWLVLCANAFNLIDGVDGLAAGLGLFATIAILAAAILQSNIALATASVPLAGCLLGFLRYNFSPATVFLGDSGSLLTGFLLGCYGVIWMQKTATLPELLAPMMALSVPLLDVGLSVARRLLRGHPIFTADRGHIHHRLLDRGLTPRRAVLALYGACSLGAMFSLLLIVVRNQYAGVVVLLFCAAAWLGVQQLGYVEFTVARQMVFGGAFRRLIHSLIHLRQFEKALRESDSLDQCWETLQRVRSTFGLAGVTLCVNGRVLEQMRPGSGYDRCWTMRIALSELDYIHVMCEYGTVEAYTLGPLADIVREKLTSFESLAEQIGRLKVASHGRD